MTAMLVLRSLELPAERSTKEVIQLLGLSLIFRLNGTEHGQWVWWACGGLHSKIRCRTKFTTASKPLVWQICY